MDQYIQWDFGLTQLISLASLIIIQYGNGLLVMHKGVKVNYTRKINHFMLFLIPILLNRGYALAESYELFFLGAFLAVFKFIFYIEPIRDRVPFINTMFLSFDRPEDRPYTLLWIVTQTAAGYLVLIPMSLLFAQYNIFNLVLIPLLIYGIGDGLAEPVGVRFGKIKYRTWALFTDKKYYRSLEGSLMVFLTSLIIISFFYNQFTQPQFIIAMLTVPVLMTLAEALSPHTWDSPVMFLVGYLLLFGIAAI